MKHGSRAIPSCTAQTYSGAFCDERSLPGAPFPICLKHAAKLMAFLNDMKPSSAEDRIIAVAEAVRQDHAAKAERVRRAPDVFVVYYLQVGDTIKIGYSSNLPNRLRSYPPNAKLLAYESGGPSLERERHQQFADYLEHGNEWFRPAPELLAHIAELKRSAA